MAVAVVTGATSFLGRYLVRRLAKENRVYTIIRPGSPQLHLFDGVENITVVPVSMDDVSAWQAQIGKADDFYHLGWDGAGAVNRANETIQEKNIIDSENCMRGAKALGCRRFLFTGSQAEYGPKTQPIRETDECNPVTSYGKCKLLTGQKLAWLAQNLDMTFYHARIFSLYGEGDHPWTLISSAIKTFLNNQEMNFSSCTQHWNYMHADDAARNLKSLMESGASSGTYNVAGKDIRVLKSFVEDIHAACLHKGICSYGTYNPLEKPVSLMPDTSKVEAAIGPWTERNFQEEISKLTAM